MRACNCARRGGRFVCGEAFGPGVHGSLPGEWTDCLHPSEPFPPASSSFRMEEPASATAYWQPPTGQASRLDHLSPVRLPLPRAQRERGRLFNPFSEMDHVFHSTIPINFRKHRAKPSAGVGWRFTFSSQRLLVKNGQCEQGGQQRRLLHLHDAPVRAVARPQREMPDLRHEPGAGV